MDRRSSILGEQAQVLMQEFRQLRTGVGELEQKFSAVVGEATSADGFITVKVGPRGHLLHLDIDPRIYRNPNSGLLARTIVATAREATERATDEVDQIMDGFVPPEFRPERLAEGFGLSGVLRRHDSELAARKKVADDGL